MSDEWMTGASPITLAVINARLWTGVPNRPWAEAMAISGETIAAVGSSAEIRRLAGRHARVIDGAGRFGVPGFIDSHVHLLMGGLRLSGVRLRNAGTPEEFVARIRDFAGTVSADTWITGGDWDHSLWGGRLPSREWIDAVTSEQPVWVKRFDGHMALANGAALRAAGIDRHTAEVAGGSIVRAPDGEPTGILKDNAMPLVERVMPEPSAALKDRALEAAMRRVAEHGVTSVHHMAVWDDSVWDDLQVFERAHAAGRLRTRIYVMTPLSDWQRLRERIASTGRGDHWLCTGGLKGFADGSLGSHTAAFLEPYADAPDDAGLRISSDEELYRWASDADQAGLQVTTHAIGDAANRTVLDVYERLVRANGPRDRRLRIEHAQHVALQDVPRFGELDVIASVQPAHVWDDGDQAETLLGPERIRMAYPCRALLDGGARLAFGSDWFVAPPVPLEGIHVAVTRRTRNNGHNPDGWIPEQKITVAEALRAYTRDAAYAAFEENLKGTLEPGRLADFALIDRDLTRIPADEIRDARVTTTVVGGRIIFES